MKIRRQAVHLTVLMGLASLSACSTAPYIEDSTFTGTISELATKEQWLVDDKMLLIKADAGQRAGTVYEIPVDSFEEYGVGQKVEVVVYSNTVADVWDLNHLKFKIKVLE